MENSWNFYDENVMDYEPGGGGSTAQGEEATSVQENKSADGDTKKSQAAANQTAGDVVNVQSVLTSFGEGILGGFKAT